ncbi:chorismate mutase [Pseudomonas entomophila]|uniref:chorismate mutase n=1 Tax=Pseudomonas entomophila TaxID=312306 RepID=UPI0024063D2E|nr:chorismate mutase [Pseudomonas entomophila]MDF9620778.1 chorismate mutase [Pseudomonas entomophila]
MLQLLADLQVGGAVFADSLARQVPGEPGMLAVRGDRRNFEALVKRLGYVKAAVQFKANEQAIPAPERVAAMLQDRLEWAASEGFDAQFIEQLYTLIIHWNIDQQIQHRRSIHGENA